MLLCFIAIVMCGVCGFGSWVFCIGLFVGFGLFASCFLVLFVNLSLLLLILFIQHCVWLLLFCIAILISVVCNRSILLTIPSYWSYHHYLIDGRGSKNRLSMYFLLFFEGSLLSLNKNTIIFYVSLA